MNGLWLMAPLVLVRFILLGLLDREALGRAASFAPLEGGERTACVFYQLSSAFLLLYPAALRVRVQGPLFPAAGAVFLAGTALLALSVVCFARPGAEGFCREGVYRLLRHPMYLGYFLYFLGCGLLTRSYLLLAALGVFQLSARWIVRAEERWCLEQFGEAYRRYKNQVRR